jgi:(1->4)-alpha-D-glucan 1-alpha-D-glucosylmutase
LSRLKKQLSEDNPDFIKLLGILYVLKSLSSSDALEERHNQIKFIQHTLWEAYNSNAVIKAFVDENVRTFNGEKGKAESFNFLDDLLAQQVFRLSFWKVAAEEINYRRFFCVNGLISLKVEDEHVLNYTHGLIFDLIAKRVVTGLRIDHVDGLYDPAGYLQKVREQAPANYIIVEKILNLQENLPPDWPIQGTTGYDFTNYVNELFCQKENARAFSRIYASVTGLKNSYEDVVRANKKLMIQEDMASDVHNLAPARRLWPQVPEAVLVRQVLRQKNQGANLNQALLDGQCSVKWHGVVYHSHSSVSLLSLLTAVYSTEKGHF